MKFERPKIIEELEFKDKKFFDYEKRIEGIKKNDITFFFGDRSVGKTTSAKKYVIFNTLVSYKNNLENTLPSEAVKHNQFVWLRDKDKLIAPVASDFSAGIYLKEGYHLKGNTSGLSLYQKLPRFNKKTGEPLEPKNRGCTKLGFFLGTSRPTNARSVHNYDQVSTIIFDEVITEDGVYFGNEWDNLQSVITTIARNRKVNVILLGNNVQPENPYFDGMGIPVDMMPTHGKSRTFLIEGKRYGVEYVKASPGLKNALKDSTQGRINQGTKYGAFTSEGKWLRDNSAMILKSPIKTISIKRRLMLDERFFSVYLHGKYGFGILEEELKTGPPILYLTIKDADYVGQGERYENDLSGLVRIFRKAGVANELFFQNLSTKTLFLEWMKNYKQ